MSTKSTIVKAGPQAALLSPKCAILAFEVCAGVMAVAAVAVTALLRPRRADHADPVQEISVLDGGPVSRRTDLLRHL